MRHARRPVRHRRAHAPDAGGRAYGGPRPPSARSSTRRPTLPIPRGRRPGRAGRAAPRWCRGRPSPMLPVREQKLDDVHPFPKRDARRDGQAGGVDRFPHLDRAGIVVEGHEPRDGRPAIADGDGGAAAHPREVAAQLRFQLRHLHDLVHVLIRPYPVTLADRDSRGGHHDDDATEHDPRRADGPRTMPRPRQERHRTTLTANLTAPSCSRGSGWSGRERPPAAPPRRRRTAASGSPARSPGPGPRE